MPSCVVSLNPLGLPNEPPVPPPSGGGGGGGGGITPPILPGDVPGKGNLLYISTHKGLAIGLNAYGTTGSDGAVQWFSGNGIAPDNLTGAALVIRRFDLDPWSVSGDHFTAGWAMTDDGLYRVTGLPNLPVWSRILSTAQAQTLISSVTPPKLSWAFTPSLFVRNYVAVCIIPNEIGPDGRWIFYYTWTIDNGVTWTPTTRYVGSSSGPASLQTSLVLIPSYHVINRFFATGAFGARGGFTDADVWNPSIYEFGHHIGVMYLKDYGPGRLYGFATYDGHTGPGATWYFPYADAGGNVYPDDNVAYSFGGDHIGAGAIRRYTAEENPLWNPVTANDFRPYTNLGDSTMTGGVAGLVSNMFHEDQLYAWYGNTLWVSPVAGNSWTKNSTMTFAGRAPYYTWAYAVPISPGLCYFCGEVNSGGGYAMAFFTTDGGTSFWDVSAYGTAGALDTVMGLTNVVDMADSQIIIDRKFDGLMQPTAGATMIDVSHWNGTMNWATAYAAGIRKTFIKASQGSGYTDTQYATNWTGAHAQGIQRGAYHYFENATDPTAQANQFLAVMNSDYGELGPAVDCEDETASLTPSNLKVFLDRVETVSGKKCTIYTRASWWNKYVGHQSWTPNYPLWVANWGVSVPTLPWDWMIWTYWQFSSTGKGSTYGAQSQFMDVDKVA